MIKIVSNQEMQHLDAHTIQKLGVPGIVLMENAGRQCANVAGRVYREYNLRGPVHIYCGKGNNGGDGYVIARHLYDAGFEVMIFSVGDPHKLKGDALLNYRICESFSLPVRIINEVQDIQNIDPPSMIIDALLGTGTQGAARGLFAELIEFMNHQGALIVSVDIPSGLNGDGGYIPGPAIVAETTVTMALPKRVHVFYPARDYCGELFIADIGIPKFLRKADHLKMNMIEKSDIYLPPMESDVHKYTAGKVFILGGSPGMTGAVTLSTEGAMRTGCGLIRVGVPAGLNPILETKLTEALTVPLAHTEDQHLAMEALVDVREMVDWCDAAIIGPGAGRHEETQNLIIEVLSSLAESNKPVVADADALFALAQNEKYLEIPGEKFVLTPHHGEFIRLSGALKEQMTRAPWEELGKYMKNKKFVMNLKGAPSMVINPGGDIFVNPTGNPALARGGSGDVLAGLIGGLMARGMNAQEAAITGNFLNGYAADEAIKKTAKTTCQPSDVLNELKTCMREFE